MRPPTASGRIDMPLSLTAGLALAAFFLGDRRQKEQGRGGWPWFLAAYLAVGVGLLLKGPIAAVLPGGVALAWLALEGDWRPRRWAGSASGSGRW